MKDAQTIIVGGGIWGLSTAYHLARSGAHGVMVLERNGELAAETTPQAAGLVGQIRSGRALIGAIQYALELFGRLTGEAGQDIGFRQTGSLFVALDNQRMEAFGRQLDFARQNGVAAEWAGPSEMRRLAPALEDSRVQGGYFVSEDGYVQPQRLALAYGTVAKELGVRMELETAVRGLEIKDGKVSGVHTSKGFYEAPQVVITAGPWSGLLAKSIGYQAPMQPIRHQRVRTVPVRGIPEHHPVVRVPDLSCYLRPEQGGYLYGFFEPQPMSFNLESKPDLKTAEIEPPAEVMSEARRRLASVFPILEELEVVERNQGLTTFAPDGCYLLGPVPGVQGLFFSSGCAALGIAGSAAVGRWLANWMLKGDPGEDLAMFSTERFGELASDPERLRKDCEEFYASYYAVR